MTSQKSVLGALKTLYRKHEDMLSFVGLDSVEDDIVEDYLLKKVNKIIGEDVLVSRRFTEESAAHFIK